MKNEREHDPYDRIIHLRRWGADVTYAFSKSAARAISIGASEDCTLRLTDPDVSPMHAELIQEKAQWRIRALQSTRELRRDGERCSEFLLTPGVEVGIGRTTLIAESQRSLALREFCARLLGWGGDRRGAVDHALRAIRLAAARRSTPVLQGGGEGLVPLAHALPRRVLGPAAPFVICDRRREDLPATVRSPANRGNSVAAFEAAADGSLCVRSRRLPRDLPELLRLIDEPDTRVQVIVCMSHDGRGGFLARFPIHPMPIEVPPLAIREAELSRIVQAYAKDAIADLGAGPSCFSDDDCEWVRRHDAR